MRVLLQVVCLGFFVLIALTVYGQSEVSKVSSAENEIPPSIIHLTKGEREQLRAYLSEAGRLVRTNRSQGILIALDKALVLAPDYYAIHNLRGAAFSTMRDFESARKAFIKARELEPQAVDVKFNLAEMDFVTGKYEEALEQYLKLKSDYPKMPNQAYHLLRFKEAICLMKRERDEEAKRVIEEFTPYEKTPIYHMIHAAEKYNEGDEDSAEGWIRSAQEIYGAQPVANYLDSLAEAGWIQSIMQDR